MNTFFRASSLPKGIPKRHQRNSFFQSTKASISRQYTGPEALITARQQTWSRNAEQESKRRKTYGEEIGVLEASDVEILLGLDEGPLGNGGWWRRFRLGASGLVSTVSHLPLPLRLRLPRLFFCHSPPNWISPDRKSRSVAGPIDDPVRSRGPRCLDGPNIGSCQPWPARFLFFFFFGRNCYLIQLVRPEGHNKWALNNGRSQRGWRWENPVLP